MDNLAFGGSIDSGDLETVKRVLGKWMSTDELKVKIRLGGEEIVYESDEVYFYCHTDQPGPAGEPGYLLEGHVSGTPDHARELLERLLASFAREGIQSRFEYEPVDDEGNKIGDQVFIR
jgi:hypothetical protein